jgi:protein O-mannosyl-transferase
MSRNRIDQDFKLREASEPAARLGQRREVIAPLDGLLKKHRAVAVWLLILVAVASFQDVLKCGFVSDDIEQILKNPFVKNPHLWTYIFTGRVWAFAGGAAQGDFYRPLQILTYWLICRVDGFNPVAYHAVQLGLYSLTVWVVFRIAQRLLARDVAAFVGTLLWTLHPLHVEAVAWSAAIPEVGCTLFYLLGFDFFLRAEDVGQGRFLRHLVAALIYFPALFFKELAFSFPILLLVYWACYPSKQSWRGRALNLAPYVVACVAYLAIRRTVMGNVPGAFSARNINLRVMESAAGLLGQHARLFFWPVHLNLFRSFDLGASLHSVWPWIALLAAAGAFVGRKREPRLSFLLLWWFVTLLPCLNYRFLSIPFVADRFSYLPSVGLCLALAYLAIDWLPRHFEGMRLERAAIPALGIIAGLWGVRSIRTIPQWRDNDTLTAYSLAVSGDAAELHVANGVNLQLQKGDLDGAAREFQTALRLNARSFHPSADVAYNAYIGLGQIALLKGREQEGLDDLNHAVRLEPNFAFAYDVLGSFYFPRGNYSRAADYFQKVVQLSPMDTFARFALGDCLMKLGKPMQASEQFRAAREVDPTYLQAYTMEEAAHEAAGDHAGAVNVRNETPKD